MTKLFNKQRLKKLDKEKYEIVQSVKYITFISKKAHFNSISNYKTFLPSGGSHDSFANVGGCLSYGICRMI